MTEDMIKAFYPGTFDPITNGHLDIIERAGNCFSRVLVGISHGGDKLPLFSHQERLALAEEVLKDIPDVEVVTFHGLTVEAAKAAGCRILVRGLRVITDFDYEMQLALMNKSLADDLETVFLVSSHNYIFVSSSVIKEIAKHGEDISKFVPAAVDEALKKKISEGILK
jgi:pantetheine-phosphate adenylyltransferase